MQRKKIKESVNLIRGLSKKFNIKSTSIWFYLTNRILSFKLEWHPIFQACSSTDIELGLFNQSNDKKFSSNKKAISSKQQKNFTSNPRILLVEDDKVCQFVQLKILEQYGCTVDLAESGEEALVMFNNSYDAVILDLNLPGICGLEVSQWIRRNQQDKRTPIIGLTTQGNDRRDECLAAGYDEVAVKPANFIKLTELLSRFLQAKNTNL